MEGGVEGERRERWDQHVAGIRNNEQMNRCKEEKERKEDKQKERTEGG